MSKLESTLLLVVVFFATALSPAVRGEPFVAVKDGKATCAIVVDARASTATAIVPKDRIPTTIGYINAYFYSLHAWGSFLADRLEDATGARPEVVVGEPADGKAIVISLAENYPEIAREAGLDFDARRKEPIKYWDAFCVKSTNDRLYILGHTELGCRHGVATVLRELGFRFYNPSPRWWIIPKRKDLAVGLSLTRAPRFFNLGFATNAGHHLNHGMLGTEAYPWEIQGYWAAMNFFACGAGSPSHRVRTGPFWFRFIRRNKDELEQHPEYFALLPDGERDVAKPLLQRKLCISNPALVDLIVKDRIVELEHWWKFDRFIPTVSAEYYAKAY
ncbi:hypothetical protein HQ590_08295, partial [bacterium]|nr:hypothetical protein [bacterium]